MLAVAVLLVASVQPTVVVGTPSQLDQQKLANDTPYNVTEYSYEDDDFIFDRTDVRAIFITLYTIVFCCCFFGEFLSIILFLVYVALNFY